MNPKNDRFRVFGGIDKFHRAGYYGSRCKVGLGEDFNNTDDYSSHARKVAYVFREIAPDAELVYLPESGRNDSTFMSAQIQTIKDKHISAWGTSYITAASGIDVNGAFEQVKDFCTFFTAIGNHMADGRTVYSRLSESPLVYAVGAMHLNADGSFFPESYSVESPNVDFSAPTDWYTMDGAFDGSSGAQPVITAIATLVNDFFIDKTGKPLSSAMMYQFLRDNSHDFYTTGKDDKTGWGYVTLPEPSTIDVNKYQPTYQKEDDNVSELNIIQPNYKWAYGATIRKKTNYIVLHHVGVVGSFTPEQIHAEHLRKKWRGIAYNYYVRKDGTIYHGREENAAGGHTLNYNEVSIGICFEGNFEVEKMPLAQQESGRKLIADILTRYPLAKVVRHKDLNATACPGANFPFDAIKTAPITTPVTTSKSTIYRVQVGAFSDKKNADALLKDLTAKGYKPYITTEVKA